MPLDPALTDKFCSLPVLHISSTLGFATNTGTVQQTPSKSHQQLRCSPGAILFSCLVTYSRVFMPTEHDHHKPMRCSFRTGPALEAKIPILSKSSIHPSDKWLPERAEILKVISTGAYHVDSSYHKKKKYMLLQQFSYYLQACITGLQHICSYRLTVVSCVF